MADAAKPVPVTSYPSALSVAQVGDVRFLTNTLAQQAFEKVVATVPNDQSALIVDVQGDDGHVAALVGYHGKNGWSIALAADKAVGSGAPAGFKGVRWEGILRKSWK